MPDPDSEPLQCAAAALPKVVRVESGAAYPGRNGLFLGVADFRFVSGARGGMLVGSLPLGEVTVAVVESGGHDIALHEPGRLSFLAPLAGSVRVETEHSSLAAGAGGGLFLREGCRRTAVRADGPGLFRALVALSPLRRAALQRSRPAAGIALPRLAEAGTARALRHYLHYLTGESARADSPLRHGAARRSRTR